MSVDDWVITVPKKIKWEDYMREVKDAEERNLILNFRVRAIPKDMNPGDRIFVLWNGFIRGWMRLDSTTHIEGYFVCSTTGLEWGPGWYLQRVPPWHAIKPIPMVGFRGVRRLEGAHVPR